MQQTKRGAATPFGFHSGTDGSVTGTSLADKDAAIRMKQGEEH